MTAAWHFKQQQPDDTTRDPIQGEFFATDAITNAAEALVREGIQNSLDARSSTGPVRVRIYLSGDAHAIGSNVIDRYGTGLWAHLHAPKNGLRAAPPRDGPCRFLAFEDFGTTGLTGDVAQWHAIEGVKNAFFTFFRAEGLTDKEDKDRGRWGVGKFVFPRSSLASTFFGLTKRQDDGRRVLMGRSILKCHGVDSNRYMPDGYFGLRDGNRLILPFDESSSIEQFCTDFKLQRGNHNGLSIVVPWCEEDIDRSTILRAVSRGYFHPILTGELEVTVVAPPFADITVTSQNLEQVAKDEGGEFAGEVLPLIKLARWSIQLDSEDLFILNTATGPGALEWNQGLFPEGFKETMRSRLEKDGKAAVRVPLTVRPRGRSHSGSYFHVFFMRDPDEPSIRPVFVREGLIISEVSAPRLHGVRALVVAEDEPIATLLGDSENPAHTEWRPRTSNFKVKYLNGPSYLRFVINSPKEIWRAWTGDENEPDRTLLADIFPMDDLEDEGVETRVKRGVSVGASQSEQPDIPSLPTSRRFRIQKISGGFAIHEGDDDAPLVRKLRIRVAYDVRRGNPLKNYDPLDFDLAKKPILLDPLPENAKVVTREGNEMVVEVLQSPFCISVKGFNPDRSDLYVKVDVQEDDDGNSQA